MKVGDLVYNPSLGINGIIVDSIIVDDIPISPQGLRTVFYEDGEFDVAWDDDIEVISENPD